VRLHDGRTLAGDFQCLDREGNLVLANTAQLAAAAAPGEQQRHMGMVIIPLAQQAAVAVEAANDADRASLEAIVAGR